MPWSRVRADLARPEVPTPADERLFLIGSSALIITIAQLSDPGSAGDVAVIAVAFLGFVLRALVPTMPAELFAIQVLAPVALVVGRDAVLEGSFFLVVMMVLYTAWHLDSMTRAILIVAVSAALPWILATQVVPEADLGWEAWTSANAFTFTLGRALRRQQHLIDQLEAARSALAEQAVAEERRRIARELHDLAGHTLAAMLLHVTGARHVLRRDLEEAERALLDAEAVGRSSLDQIRATVAALRTHEHGLDPSLAGAADLPALIEEYRRAGLVVDATLSGTTATVNGAVGTALHRIAREALANVARHAPGNTVELTVAVDDDAATLVVADRGQPGAEPDPNAGHFGLVGMQERARALGGELNAGPTPDGWQVEARLPAPVVDRNDFVPT